CPATREAAVMRGMRRADQPAFYAALLRHVAGNPFRPPTFERAWLSWDGGTVRELARSLYDDRPSPDGTLDTCRLAVLADALEEASCTDAALLGHCREPGPHYRGCWLVDGLLGKA